MRLRYKHHAFTLAEVLIALALLGVIAAFAIPKVMQTVGNERNKAVSKEALAMLSETMEKAYFEGKLVSGQTKLSDILDQSLNATRDTTAEIDAYQPPTSCAPPGRLCWRLGNGAIVTTSIDQYYRAEPGRGMTITVDPDGKLSGGSLTNRQSLWVALYSDRKIATLGTLPRTMTIDSVAGGDFVYNPGEEADPAWFQY